MEEFFVLVGVLGVVVGLPWVLLHYITKWKQAPKITDEDERMLDEMYTLARRLEDRVATVERIVAADNPDFRHRLTSPADDYRASLDKPRTDYRPLLDQREPDYRSTGRN